MQGIKIMKIDWSKISSLSSLDRVNPEVNWARLGCVSDLLKFAGLPTAKQLWENEKISSLFENEDEFLKFLAVDPTFDNEVEPKHFRWLLHRRVKEPTFFDEEGLTTIKGYLDTYEKVKSQLPEDKRNLNKVNFPTVESLYDTIRDFLPKSGETYISNSQRKKQVYREDVERIYDLGDWKIEKPLSYEATCLLGTNTKWCIASNTTDKFYRSYSNNGTIYVVTRKSTNTKYAIVPEHKEFRDAEDAWGYGDWLLRIPDEEKKEINDFIYSNIWGNLAFDNNANKEKLVVDLFKSSQLAVTDKYVLDSMTPQMLEAIQPELIAHMNRNPEVSLYFNSSSPAAKAYIKSHPATAIKWLKEPTEEQLLSAINVNENTTSYYSPAYYASNAKYFYDKGEPSEEFVQKALDINPLIVTHLRPSSITQDMADKLMERNAGFVNMLPPSLQRPEAWYEAVEADNSIIREMPEELRTQELWANAFARDPRIFLELPEELQTNERANYFLKTYPLRIPDVPKRFQTAEAWQYFAQASPESIRTVPKKFRTSDMWYAAIEAKPKLIKSMPPELQTDAAWITAVTKYPSLIDKLPEAFRSQSTYDSIVSKRPSLIEKIPENFITDELAEYVSRRRQKKVPLHHRDPATTTQKEWEKLIHKEPHMLDFVPEEFKTESFWQVFVKGNSYRIKDVPKEYQTQDAWERAVINSPRLLKDMPEEFMTQALLDAMLEKEIVSVPEEYQTQEAWINYANITPLQNIMYSLNHMPKRFQTQELFNVIASRFPTYVNEIPREFQTQEMWDNAVQMDQGLIRHLLDRDDIAIQDQKSVQAGLQVDWTKISSITDLLR